MYHYQDRCEQYSSRSKYIYRIIYHKTRSNLIEIRKILNRYNFENNDFRSTSERSLKARNFSL